MAGPDERAESAELAEGVEEGLLATAVAAADPQAAAAALRQLAAALGPPPGRFPAFRRATLRTGCDSALALLSSAGSAERVAAAGAIAALARLTVVQLPEEPVQPPPPGAGVDGQAEADEGEVVMAADVLGGSEAAVRAVAAAAKMLACEDDDDAQGEAGAGAAVLGVLLNAATLHAATGAQDKGFDLLLARLLAQARGSQHEQQQQQQQQRQPSVQAGAIAALARIGTGCTGSMEDAQIRSFVTAIRRGWLLNAAGVCAAQALERAAAAGPGGAVLYAAELTTQLAAAELAVRVAQSLPPQAGPPPAGSSSVASSAGGGEDDAPTPAALRRPAAW